jgi:hypothetical protein
MFTTKIGIRDIFCVVLDIVLDIEIYEFLVLGIKSLILLGIISLIPIIFPVITRHLHSNWN